jgi:solute carrier family 45 protein 1/2/4
MVKEKNGSSLFLKMNFCLGRTIGHWFGDATNDISNSTKFFNQTNFVTSQIFISFSSRKFATIITVLGVVLLDLDCDACQSPSRAYLLDVTNPSQHSLGLTTFTAMAGIGGCVGYFLGGIPWENTFLTKILGDHIHVLFTLVWIIYLICLILTVTAAKEPSSIAIMAPCLSRSVSRQYLVSSHSINSMSSSYENNERNSIIEREQCDSKSNRNFKVSYLDYLRSIIYMPSSLKWLCLTNFFCWMALVSYSLYFTDFVGQAVFGKISK